jgi:hypothetical protein
MYRERKPMCNEAEENIHPRDRRTVTKISPSTGSKEKMTYFSDGSSIRHCGGPCGPMHYDENGEEC